MQILLFATISWSWLQQSFGFEHKSLVSSAVSVVAGGFCQLVKESETMVKWHLGLMASGTQQESDIKISKRLPNRQYLRLKQIDHRMIPRLSDWPNGFCTMTKNIST